MSSSAPLPIGRSRVAVGCTFFLLGLCFSSWGSRIPAIQQTLQLDDTTLGSVLFALPVGSMISSVLAPWFVERYGAKRMLAVGFILYSLILVAVGVAASAAQLALGLVLFGCLSNVVNVSVNTQAIGVEHIMGRSVMASFHGLWSLAGFAGAAIGMGMIGLGLSPVAHFAVIALLVWLGLALTYRSLLSHTPGAVGEKQPFFAKPTKALWGLGLIAFCSMICEGTMFDWSGLYCQNVIKTSPAWIGLGYASFMSAMAGTRFIADRLKGIFGLQRMLIASGILITAGLLMLVVQPHLITGVLGFVMVGAGTSSVVPLVVSQAGKEPGLSPSLAIATVSTIGFVGFVVGPPLIGWISGVMGLRAAFLLIAVMGSGVIGLSLRQFAVPAPRRVEV